MSALTALAMFSIVAMASSALITPLVRRLALRFDLVDQPDGHRKLHSNTVPLGGGVAVFAGLCLAVLLAMAVPQPWQRLLLKQGPDLLAMLAAGGLIVAVGLIDDRYGLRGRHKLAGQIAAALILIGRGLVIQKVALFGSEIPLGLLSVPFTMFWLVGAINALNLIDGIDGLATTVGVILSATIGALALWHDHQAAAVVALALSGSLLGFLGYNFPPAKIFLGDAGSMLIGLVVGALAIKSSLKGPATVALAAPLAVLTIPILDSTAALMRRKLTGRSMYATDRAHLHHRLLDLFGSGRKTLVWIALFCACTSVGALLSTYAKNDLLALITAASVVAILVVTRVFGHVELLLLGSRLKSVGLSMVNLRSTTRGQSRQASIRLQGNRPWEMLWTTLTEFAEKLRLSGIRLNVNSPADREGYHASWERPTRGPADGTWRMEIPLLSQEQVVGRLVIVGEPGNDSICEVVTQLLDLLQPFETQFQTLARLNVTPATPRGKWEDDTPAAPLGVGETSEVGKPI